MEGQNTENKQTLESLRTFLRSRFDLSEDQADQGDVKDNIRKGVEFKGINLWVLIFATFVASLGLNVNSTAVIIGAMLISPLMGPIMGIGLSVGINDFELMKRSARNFGFMVLVSILTSTFYFFISPISSAQSELLARTVPTTYDVLIAFFGGLAGIVAQTRKDRSALTVIPGVAIATALMPPLCTAGYGLATMQFTYFIGAFYLFFINTVFIAIATYVVVRFMKFQKKEFLDAKREQRVKRYMILIVLATLIPSIIIGVRLVKRTVFETNAKRYVENVMKFPNSQVIDYSSTLTDGHGNIEVFLIGDPVSNDAIENARLQLASYNLAKTTLQVHQSGDSGSTDFKAIGSGYRELLTEKNQKIEELEKEVNAFGKVDTLAGTEITKEMSALAPGIQTVTLTKGVGYNSSGHISDTTVVCIVSMKSGHLSPADIERLKAWLQTRTKTANIKFYTE